MIESQNYIKQLDTILTVTVTENTTLQVPDSGNKVFSGYIKCDGGKKEKETSTAGKFG